MALPKVRHNLVKEVQLGGERRAPSDRCKDI